MENKLKENSGLPMYRQLSNIIRTNVENGVYEVNQKIPTEMELSKKYNVSRVTVRKALEELVEDGILLRKQGKGTFISEKKTTNANYPQTSFADACLLSGKKPATRLLSYSMEVPTKKIADFFEIEQTEMVIKIRRIRMADGEPIILEVDYFPESFAFLADEALTDSIALILNRNNIYPIHGETVTTICYASEEESRVLNVDVEQPLLYIRGEIRNEDMRPVQVSKQIIRTDLYRLTQQF